MTKGDKIVFGIIAGILGITLYEYWQFKKGQESSVFSGGYTEFPYLN